MDGAPAATPVDAPEIKRTRLSGPVHANVNYKNRAFSDTPGRKKRFTDCDFSYSVFTRAYFKEATFEDCNFTGCRFYDCNFIDANFLSCDLKYSNFSRCLMDVPAVVAALPREPNLRRALIQNLRANANEVGDYEHQKLLVLAQVGATEEYLLHALRGDQDYYKAKFATSLDRIIAGARLAVSKLSGFTWGHGENIASLAKSSTVLLLAFSLINLFHVIPSAGWQGGMAIINSTLYVFSLFFEVPYETTYKGFLFIDFAILIMRYLYFGLLVSMIYKSVSYR